MARSRTSAALRVGDKDYGRVPGQGGGRVLGMTEPQAQAPLVLVQHI